MSEKENLKKEEVAKAAGGVLAANHEFDRCPMCDNPTPVVNGRCKCESCGHSWWAGSH